MVVQLTVILVRDAEHANDVRYGSDPDRMRAELDESTVNDDLKAYIADQAGDEAGNGEDEVTLSQRVDPELTEAGYVMAQDVMDRLLTSLSSSSSPEPQERKIAFVSAPNRACTSTALMVSCADVSDRSELNWRWTTLESASAPAAIPVVVHNGLCNAEPHVQRMGGYRAVTDAGLMHGAALPWNDGRTKCPLMKVFKKMKEKTQQRIDDWDEARDETGKKIHFVNYLQYLRVETPTDPWSLVEMVPKINLVVDFVEPKRYMLPPRQGWFDPKKQYKEWQDGVDKYVKEAVWLARSAGCDTVVMVVPASTVQDVIQASGGGGGVESPVQVSPCCVASFIATAGDGASSSEDVDLQFHKFADAPSLTSDTIPPHGGPIAEIMHPHPGKDPADAPENRWALFPDPEPEVLPRNYPKLPPFSMCLEQPLPPPPKKKQGANSSSPKKETAPTSSPKRSPKKKATAPKQ